MEGVSYRHFSSRVHGYREPTPDNPNDVASWECLLCGGIEVAAERLPIDVWLALPECTDYLVFPEATLYDVRKVMDRLGKGYLEWHTSLEPR